MLSFFLARRKEQRIKKGKRISIGRTEVRAVESKIIAIKNWKRKIKQRFLKIKNKKLWKREPRKQRTKERKKNDKEEK